MNAPLIPEKFLPAGESSPQEALPLAAEGVQRWVWHSRFGPMLIEVVGEQVYVNGQAVEPHRP